MRFAGGVLRDQAFEMMVSKACEGGVDLGCCCVAENAASLWNVFAL